MTAPQPPLGWLAQTEFTARRANFREGMNARRITQAQANAGMAHWAAIAAYFGAPLPPELCDSNGDQPIWLDFYPAGQCAHVAMQAMAGELRRATLAIIARYQQAPSPALAPRVLALIKLDSHLHHRAGLPPLVIDGPLTPGLEGPERQAA